MKFWLLGRAFYVERIYLSSHLFSFSFLIIMCILELVYQLKVVHYARGLAKNAALKLLNDTFSMVLLASQNGYNGS